MSIFKTSAVLLITLNSLTAQKFVLEQDQRVKDSFYYEHTDISYFAKGTNHFTAFGGYRFIVEDKGEWKNHSRFHAGANIKVEGRGGKIVNRSRYEFTPGHELGNLGSSNGSRFRNRIKYYLPYRFTKYDIRPNISDEFFFDINKGFDYTRNRFAIGLGAKIGKFKPELYYFNEFKKKNGWSGVNVFGFLVKYEF